MVTAWLTNNYNTQITNISRIKGNQAMKFGHLIEHNKRNILLKKSCRKLGRETNPTLLFVF